LGLAAVTEKGNITMIRSAAFLAIAMALATVGCGSAPSASSSLAAPPPASSRPPSVDAQAALPASPGDSGDILSVLSVEHQVDVATERDGMVISIAKDEGSVVNKGDVLGQLDDRSLRFELIKAQDDLLVAQNNVKYKQAEEKAKGAALDRQQQLRKLGLSSEADLEAADFEAKAAEYDEHGWEAMVESSKAEIERLQVEIDQTRLRAPFSGSVVSRYIREGQEVAKGDKCFRVSQLAPLQVQFQIPESTGLRPVDGAGVSIVLVEDPRRTLRAQVVKVSPIVDPASDSYNVTAELTGKGLSDLRPGMAVRVAWHGLGHAAP
jgi:RND family efflux transporter MFP subunit